MKNKIEIFKTFQKKCQQCVESSLQVAWQEVFQRLVVIRFPLITFNPPPSADTSKMQMAHKLLSFLATFYCCFSWLLLVRSRGEQIVFLGRNKNMNTFRFQKFVGLRIRILLGFRNMPEYEYEYYLGSEIWPNTNTNTIRSATFVRIRIRILRLFE